MKTILITAFEKRILDALEPHDGARAYMPDIYEVAGATGPTVHRAIDLLMAAGVMRRVMPAVYVRSPNVCLKLRPPAVPPEPIKPPTIAKDKNEVLDEAKGAGLKKKSIRAVVKKHDLERKIEAIRENMDDDDADDYDQVLQALGELGNTPLGQSALSKTKNGASEQPGA